MFTGGTREKTAYEIEMIDFHHLSLLTAIEYCYTDDVRYMDDVIAVDLLITANKLWYGIEGSKEGKRGRKRRKEETEEDEKRYLIIFFLFIHLLIAWED